MAIKKNKTGKSDKKTSTKKKRRPSMPPAYKVKQESSFTGSVTEHNDGSVFLFIDIQHKDGNEAKNLSLSKEEVGGLKKFFNFLDLG